MARVLPGPGPGAFAPAPLAPGPPGVSGPAPGRGTPARASTLAGSYDPDTQLQAGFPRCPSDLGARVGETCGRVCTPVAEQYFSIPGFQAWLREGCARCAPRPGRSPDIEQREARYKGGEQGPCPCQL